MARKRRGSAATVAFFVLVSLIAFAAFVPAFAPLPSLSLHRSGPHEARYQSFKIDEDKFWKDGKPFQIIGGDLHYFRILPEYWEDRLLRAKALGLNTIQTYVPWNLHEPKPGELMFEGIADIISYLKLCQKLDLLVMLRVGPYICGEWDFGGFPPWLLSIEPKIKLRSSDPAYSKLVDRWWSVLLPKVASFLYQNGGPVIMVQIENEYGSYGNDKAYMRHLVDLARGHLGSDIVLYTTDGGTIDTLRKGTVGRKDVFSAVDFDTGSEPWPAFQLQKLFNPPGKSPPLCAEFYTGWLTHWREELAQTGANFTAAALEKILVKGGSAVLYMAHGGTNFGFYNGANTGGNEADYKPDLTSYDYDAPIKEHGDVDNPKYKAIRKVVERYSVAPLPQFPSNIRKTGYGKIHLQRSTSVFGLISKQDPANVVVSEKPLSMEAVGQMFGFLLYSSDYSTKDDGGYLSIPKVHDRGQVYVSCQSRAPAYAGVIERWSDKSLRLPVTHCAERIKLYILVENMGRVNYGQYIYDQKGILSSVYLNGKTLNGWEMYQIPLGNLNEAARLDPVIHLPLSDGMKFTSHKILSDTADKKVEPAFYFGRFYIPDANQIKDTFISFKGWGKGVAYVNDFNIGRYWPSSGPQCNLYVPAPILRRGENIVVVFELESPEQNHSLYSIDEPDFSCGSTVKEH
ncbi:hypothetical protein MLD38_030245 [Melastoma candidum]|uniref:Uncharacterized protein n=1 Tax=Melastoma candidum TaxID=119954 RepID=A0ACB9MN49_9MYRT|nr:hypothetical protein MLD38_030245 [Melastoma candidum]